MAGGAKAVTGDAVQASLIIRPGHPGDQNRSQHGNQAANPKKTEHDNQGEHAPERKAAG